MNGRDVGIETLRDAMARANREIRRQELIPGYIGIKTDAGSYIINHPKRADFVYVTLGTSGQLGTGTALNVGGPRWAGYPVLLERDNDRLVVVGPDGGRMDAFRASNPVGSYAVAPHTHRTHSGLEYETEALAFEPGRVLHVSGMTVRIRPFRYVAPAGTWATYAGGTIDLTANKPAVAGNHAWVVVGVDPSTNTATAATGSSVAYATALARADIDGVLADDMIPLMAIDVRADDTSLVDIDKYTDARGWLNVGGGGGSVADPLSIGEIRAKDANGLKLRDDAGNYGLFIADGGNAAFGTGTIPAWGGAFSAVHFGAQGALMYNNVGFYQHTQNAYYNGTEYLKIGAGYAARQIVTSGQWIAQVSSAGGGAAGDVITWIDAIRHNASGQVIINNSSTEAATTVKAKINGDAASDVVLSLGVGSGQTAYLVARGIGTGTNYRNLGLIGNRIQLAVAPTAEAATARVVVDIAVGGVTKWADFDHTANGQGDFNLFGNGAAAQAGAFYSRLRIFGGSGQTRHLALYQIASGETYIESTFEDLNLLAPSGKQIKLTVGSTEMLNAGSDLVLASGGGDVYTQTNTYAPSIQGTTDPTVSYDIQKGRYYVIGKRVRVWFYIQVKTISGGSGTMRLSLPFASANNTNESGFGAGYFIGSGVNGVATWEVQANRLFCFPWVGITIPAVTQIGNGGILAGTLEYIKA